MEWLRKMLQRAHPPAPESTRSDLDAAHRQLDTELGKADRAIAKAMRHADEAFDAAKRPYRGPDRRHAPR